MKKRFLLVTLLGLFRGLMAHGQGTQAPPREAIARALGPESEPFASAVRDPGTTATAVPSRLLGHGQIYRFEKLLPTRPLLFYVGVHWDKEHKAPGPIVLLTGKPEAFVELVRLEQVHPRTGQEAIDLIRLYDETTRPTGQRHLLVESVEQIPYRPNLSEERARVRDESVRSLRERLHPLTASRSGDGWTVTGFAIDGMVLNQMIFTISPRGEIRITRSPLRRDLPLVYAN